MERRALRQLFVEPFEARGMRLARGGWQLQHDEVTWSVALHVDGFGPASPYRLILGASVHNLSPHVSRKAGDEDLSLPLYCSATKGNRSRVPTVPEAAFPEWGGTAEERAVIIAKCIDDVVDYIRSVNSVNRLRERYVAGDYDGALITAPLRVVLEAAS